MSLHWGDGDPTKKGFFQEITPIMSLGQQLAPHLPFLRRYGRALTGSQSHGDKYVRATLEAIVAAPEQFPRDVDPRLGLYRTFQVIWSSANYDELDDNGADGGGDQAEAIARSTETCLSLGVPLISAIVGEGGSGGAIALAAGNRVLMFEHAVYSVISPEGCASILWRTADKAADAAEAMKVTAQDLKKLGVIDQIVAEPLGGAHRDPAAAAAALGDAMAGALAEIEGLDPAALRRDRREKFLAIGRL